MKSIVWLLALTFAALLRAQDPAAELEREIAAVGAGPTTTVVHFWAPWCPNCEAEMSPAGWTKFIAASPRVKFVFLNIWHTGQNPAPKLAAAGLGAQPNVLFRTHPNPSRRAADRLNSFLGLPLTWIPATWIYRDGNLRAALNYGEIRSPVLQQLVDDAQADWDR